MQSFICLYNPAICSRIAFLLSYIRRSPFIALDTTDQPLKHDLSNENRIFSLATMSYSISFLPPSQPRQSSVPRPRSATQSTLMAGSSCHESRTYLDKLNEQQQALVRPLIARVEHWKGHCLCSFGKPLLQAKTMISRTPPGGETSMNETSTRQYQVFLFSNILVCCRKRSRPNAQGKDWTLKGRVFLRNVYDVERVGGEFKWMSVFNMQRF